MINEIICYFIVERSYIYYIFLDDDGDDECDDTDESISNRHQNATTILLCEIDNVHEMNGTQSSDCQTDVETDDIEMAWNKMDDSEINATNSDNCKLNGTTSNDSQIIGTEIDNSGTDGTTSDGNEIDETQTHTALMQNSCLKLAPKKSALFDLSGIVIISFYL